MNIAFLFFLSALFGQEITVQNNHDGPLTKGFPVFIPVEQNELPAFITHRGKVIATRLLYQKELWFKTEEVIEKGKEDSLYILHKGQAKKPSPEKVFTLFENFSEQTHPFQKTDGLSLLNRNGRLYLTELPEKHTPLFPAKLPLELDSFPNNFSFQVDFEVAIESPGHAKYGVEILFQRTKSLSKDIETKIEKLITQLNSNSWNQRESATHELIKIGSLAEGQVKHALKKKDPEVRWRAEFILKEIQSGSSWSGITAGFELDHPEIKPVALTWRIGPTANRMRYSSKGSVEVRLEIQRDQNGYVTISWNGKEPTLPIKIKGEVEGIHLYGFQAVPGSAILAINNLLLHRYLDEEAQPTVTVRSGKEK